MKLTIATPLELVLQVETDKVIAMTPHGNHCFLPRHADGVTSLSVGILDYTNEAGDIVSVGLNAGSLVKFGNDIRVSTRNAIESSDLSELQFAVEKKFNKTTDDERRAQTALTRLEAGLIRRIVDLERRHG